jgi:hypothetical protein
MSRIATCLLALVLLAAPALAVVPPQDLGHAVLGIYTQPAATPEADVMIEGAVPGLVYDLYFVLYHQDLDSHNLGGYEFSWRFDPVASTPIITELDYGRDDVFNFGDNFNLLVGLQQRDPHLPEEPWLLLTARVLFTEVPNNTVVFLEPATPASIDGEMAYTDLVLPDNIRVMKPNNAGQTCADPVFWFNQSVAVEAASWSEVKALFD